MRNFDHQDFLKQFNKMHETDRRFFFEILMHMNGCDRGIAGDLYQFIEDASGACNMLYSRQRENEGDSHDRFKELAPADAFRFLQLIEHLGRNQENAPNRLAFSDFLELLAQEPESLHEFLSLSDQEKTRRFNALLERFQAQDADLKSSLESITDPSPADDSDGRDAGPG